MARMIKERTSRPGIFYLVKEPDGSPCGIFVVACYGGRRKSKTVRGDRLSIDYALDIQENLRLDLIAEAPIAKLEADFGPEATAGGVYPLGDQPVPGPFDPITKIMEPFVGPKPRPQQKALKVIKGNRYTMILGISILVAAMEPDNDPEVPPRRRTAREIADRAQELKDAILESERKK